MFSVCNVLGTISETLIAHIEVSLHLLKQTCLISFTTFKIFNGINSVLHTC